MLTRIPVHRFPSLGLIRCRAAIAKLPIINPYFAPTCIHRRLLSDSPAATAATKDRRWVMLSSYCRRHPEDDSSFVAVDANTMAESCTSKGQRVRVSLRCAAPPSSSYLYYDFPEREHVDEGDRIRVIAAHGELVLLEMDNYTCRPCSVEHFVYRPAGTLRPPSLSLLPVPDFPTKPEAVSASDSYLGSPNRPRLDSGSIGLLRRGENDILVVHANLRYEYDTDGRRRQMVVFCVLRPGMCQWELMEPVPILENVWSSQGAIHVVDQFLCFICSGDILVCEMADEASPKVRYVCPPLEVRRCSYGSEGNRMRVQRIGAAGDSCVRFVSIHPNCCRSIDPDHDLYINDNHDCCCREGRTECWHPRFVFTIKTWTMNIGMDEPLEWLEDGVISGEEIWSLPGYEGLPQAIPEWPVVCLDELFVVSNYHFTRDEEKVWMVQLDISTKTLLSVVQLTRDSWGVYYHLPAEIQY